METNKKGKTFSLRNYLAIILTSVALLIVPFGCAHRPQVKAPPLPKLTEAELGRVAVASACFEPLFEYFKPLTKGKAAAQGAEEALMGFLEGIIGNPSAVGAIVLSPVVAAGGAIYGTIEGETTETTRKAEETLNHSFTDLGIQKVMQDRVLSLARERARYTFVEPEQCGPKVLDEEITYDSLKGTGIDTVLEISVRNLGLWRKSYQSVINPPLSLLMTVSIRLIRINDNTLLSDGTLGFQTVYMYESRKKWKLTKWAKKDAQLFREEFDRCLGGLAERIVDELFNN